MKLFNTVKEWVLEHDLRSMFILSVAFFALGLVFALCVGCGGEMPTDSDVSVDYHSLPGAAIHSSCELGCVSHCKTIRGSLVCSEHPSKELPHNGRVSEKVNPMSNSNNTCASLTEEQCWDVALSLPEALMPAGLCMPHYLQVSSEEYIGMEYLYCWDTSKKKSVPSCGEEGKFSDWVSGHWISGLCNRYWWFFDHRICVSDH